MLPDQLARYRVAVADDGAGSELADIVAGLRASGCTVGAVVGYRVGGPELVRVPRPHPKDHPREALLRHKSLMAARSWDRPAWLHGERARDEVVGLWRTAAPLGTWLARHVTPGGTPAPGRRADTA